MKSFFLIAAITFVHASFAANLQDALKEYQIRVNQPETLTVTKDQHLSGKSKSEHRIEAKGNNHERFEIKVISPVEAKLATALIESESSIVKKLFAPPQTPYMGDIAQAIGECPASFGPIEKKVSLLQKDILAILGAADSKYSFGACTSETAKFRGGFLAYYDEATKAVWFWRVFTPWTKSDALRADWLEPLLSRFRK